MHHTSCTVFIRLLRNCSKLLFSVSKINIMCKLLRRSLTCTSHLQTSNVSAIQGCTSESIVVSTNPTMTWQAKSQNLEVPSNASIRKVESPASAPEQHCNYKNEPSCHLIPSSFYFYCQCCRSHATQCSISLLLPSNQKPQVSSTLSCTPMQAPVLFPLLTSCFQKLLSHGQKISV